MFLHEGLGSVALWREFPDRLARATGRRALVYSRAGHGQSDLPDGDRTPRFMHEEALDVLPGLLEDAGIERPVLVGHSDGGSIALIHASQHPVSALVLLAPHVFVEDITVASIEEARETFATTDLGDAHGPLPPRPRAHVPALERHLARARVPRLEHRGRAGAA